MTGAASEARSPGPRTHGWLWLAVLGVALLGVGAGCGEGDRAPSEDRRTAAEYRQLQGKICRQQRGALAQVRGPRTYGELTRHLQALVRINRPYVDRAEGVLPPRGLEPLHRRYIAVDRKALSETERLIKQVRASDAPESTVGRWIEDVAPLMRESQTLGSRMGLDECRLALLPLSDRDQPEPEPEAADPSTCRDLEHEKQLERKELTTWVREARGDQKTIDELEEELRSYPEDSAEIEPDLRSARRDLQDSQREIRSLRQVLEELDDESREEGCGR
jgi:hypothetical protein